ILSALFLKPSLTLPNLHSFPTRRSSDLNGDIYIGSGSTNMIARISSLTNTPTFIVVGIGPFHVVYDFANHDMYASNYYSGTVSRSEEHTSELQSRFDLVCRLLLEKKKNK